MTEGDDFPNLSEYLERTKKAADDYVRPKPKKSDVKEAVDCNPFKALKRTVIDIPICKISNIVGRAGDVAEEIERITGARVEVYSDSKVDGLLRVRGVELGGEPEERAAAKQRIEQIVDGLHNVSYEDKHHVINVPVENMEKIRMFLRGETVGSNQNKSGARIKVMHPRHETGDISREGNVHVEGTEEQIELAKQLVNEIINEQAYHPPANWVPQAQLNMPQALYGYPAPPPACYYGNNPPQTVGWDQSKSLTGPHEQSAENYNGQQYQTCSAASNLDCQTYEQDYSQGLPYNGQNRNAAFGQIASSRGHGNAQPGAYPQQVATQQGYAQQLYSKPPTYGMPSHGPALQSCGPPRASQPGDVPYQNLVSSAHSYGQTVPSQQPYPYAASGPTQQAYPYGSSQPANDGYNQPPTHSVPAPVYPPPGVQPVSDYGQPGGQPVPGYAQAWLPGSYGPFSSQTGYDSGYGNAPMSAYGAPPSTLAGYVQSASNQPAYEKPAAQSGGYASVPGSAPGFVKNLSPQPVYGQYDSTQMYGGTH